MKQRTPAEVAALLDKTEAVAITEETDFAGIGGTVVIPIVDLLPKSESARIQFEVDKLKPSAPDAADTDLLS